MKNYLTFTLLSIIAISCGKDENEKQAKIPVTHYVSSIELRVQDSEGTDLLNRQNTGYYKDSEIEVFDNKTINAVFIQEYSSETDYYYLKLNLNYPEPEINKGQHYEVELVSEVKFGKNEADEIKGLYEVKYHQGDDTSMGGGSGYTVILQKAWFNDEEIYEIQASQSSDWKLPVIVKEPNN